MYSYIITTLVCVGNRVREEEEEGEDACWNIALVASPFCFFSSVISVHALVNNTTPLWLDLLLLCMRVSRKYN